MLAGMSTLGYSDLLGPLPLSKQSICSWSRILPLAPEGFLAWPQIMFIFDCSTNK